MIRAGSKGFNNPRGPYHRIHRVHQAGGSASLPESCHLRRARRRPLSGLRALGEMSNADLQRRPVGGITYIFLAKGRGAGCSGIMAAPTLCRCGGRGTTVSPTGPCCLSDQPETCEDESARIISAMPTAAPYPPSTGRWICSARSCSRGVWNSCDFQHGPSADREHWLAAPKCSTSSSVRCDTGGDDHLLAAFAAATGWRQPETRLCR